jgi:hypothetical protein
MLFLHFKFQLLQSYVAYIMFLLLPKMLPLLSLRKLGEFIYENLLK